jgi:hypothetical protein
MWDFVPINTVPSELSLIKRTEEVISGLVMHGLIEIQQI